MSYVNNVNHREYTTARGEVLKIHAVPHPIIRTILPKRPMPQMPVVDMQVARGSQKRPIKQGDAGWTKYQQELQAWEQERDDLQDAVTYVFALKDYKYPDTLELSIELQGLVDAGLIKAPDNPYVLKFMWLRENVFGEHDEYNIKFLLRELSGVPEDIVAENKRNFRDILLGTSARNMGTEAVSITEESQDDI